MTDNSDNKLTQELKYLHEKQYGMFDYISGVAWSLWVNTYHWYFNTQTYKDYLLSLKFLKYWRERNPSEIIETLKAGDPR